MRIYCTGVFVRTRELLGALIRVLSQRNASFVSPQVLYLQAAALVWVATTLLKKVFFGTLRAAEVEVQHMSVHVRSLQINAYTVNVYFGSVQK